MSGPLPSPTAPTPPAPARGRTTLLILAGLGLFFGGVAAGYQMRFHRDLADRPQPGQAAGLTRQPSEPTDFPPPPPPTTTPAKHTPLDPPAAMELWRQAEAYYVDRKYAAAKKAYDQFQTQYAATQLYKVNLEALQERQAAIADALNPAPRPGLIGWYFSGRDFADGNLLIERMDGPVDFAWGGGQPAPEVPADGFCVRWVGTLQVKQAGHYTLAIVTDDGGRLLIDGQKVVEQWADQGDTRAAGEVDLTAGDHRIVMEYYENGGGATARLCWALKDGFAETVVPAAALWHDPQELKHPPARPALNAPGPTPPADGNNNDDLF